MQDQENKPSDEHGQLDKLIAKIADADVVVLLGSSENDGNALTVQTILPPGVAFNPAQVKSHAYAHAINQEHGNLVRRMNGVPTDADRYRALRSFAVLAGSNPARFEQINELMQKMEEQTGMKGEAKSCSEKDHDQFADFLHMALIETEPVLTAPTVQPDLASSVKAPSIILRH